MHCKNYSHFFSKKYQNICVSLDVNFNESLTNNIVSFEQLGPEQAANLHNLIRAFVIHIYSTVFNDFVTAQYRFLSGCENAPADLGSAQRCLFDCQFNGQVNTIKVMSSQLDNLLNPFFLGRLSPLSS